MATVQEIISAATIDPALLAALKAAAPEQVGDDLVLRLADGRVFYIDGFFAAAEIGDGQPPEQGAIPLAADIAALLLGAQDFSTAAGGEIPPPPPSGGAGFIPFDASSAGTPTIGDASPTADQNLEDDSERRDRLVSRLRDTSDVGTADGNVATSHSSLFSQFGSGFLGSSGFSGAGLPQSGAVSMSASALSSPSFGFNLNLADLVAVHQLKDPAYDDWFTGMTHLLPLDSTGNFATLDFATLKALFPAADDPDHGQNVYNYYVSLHDVFLNYVDGRSVWMADASTNGPHSNQTGAELQQYFSGDDIIIGTTVTENPNNTDTLRGYAGNDIIIAYDGQNDLDGGAGNDILIVTQPVTAAAVGGGAYPPLQNISGGDGYDTLVLQLMDGGYVIDTRLYPEKITSIEELGISIYVPAVPQFIVTDTHGFALEGYPPVILLDAAVVAKWGGTLTVNAAFGSVHLTDLPVWTRLPDDPARPGYALYTAEHDGTAVSLAIVDTLAQPIDGAITGTSGNDKLAWVWRSFTDYDAGAGDDTITTQLTPYIAAPAGFGILDLVGPTTPTLHNIEIIDLVAGDQLILSAADVAMVTDARNTLWVTSDFATEQNPAAGKLVVTDADTWQSLGYVSLITETTQSVSVHRTGALFAAQVNGETVQMFVSAGIELPAALSTENLDTLSIWYDGVVALPPPGFATDLDTIDFGGGIQDNSFNLSLADVRDLAGDDGQIKIITDSPNDVVTFADPNHWQLTGVERGQSGSPDFYVYLGHDAAGSDVTLRLETDLIEPAANLHATGGSDLLRVAEAVPINLDGQGGFDALQILGENNQMAGQLDLAAMDGQGPRNIELLDLRNGGDNNLILDTEAVARLSGDDVLYVMGDDAADGLDRVFLQDVGNWTRTGVLSGGNGAPDFVRYETDAVINATTMHLTLAVEGDLGQPIGAPLP